jgi:copper chaperone NosL
MYERTAPRVGMRRQRPRLLATLAFTFVLAACSAGPVPIAYDQDGCDFCRMQISDPRYGAELITRTGKVHKFDSIECLASFYSTLHDSASVRSLWVSDYLKPGTFLPASEALYIHHTGPGSPMGRGLLALQAGGGSEAGNAGVPAGETLNWSQVVELVAREGLAPGVKPLQGADSSSVGVRAGAADAHGH